MAKGRVNLLGNVHFRSELIPSTHLIHSQYISLYCNLNPNLIMTNCISLKRSKTSEYIILCSRSNRINKFTVTSQTVGVLVPT